MFTHMDQQFGALDSNVADAARATQACADRCDTLQATVTALAPTSDRPPLSTRPVSLAGDRPHTSMSRGSRGRATSPKSGQAAAEVGLMQNRASSETMTEALVVRSSVEKARKEAELRAMKEQRRKEKQTIRKCRTFTTTSPPTWSQLSQRSAARSTPMPLP